MRLESTSTVIKRALRVSLLSLPLGVLLLFNVGSLKLNPMITSLMSGQFSTQWHYETVRDPLMTPWFDLALDIREQPHISYCDEGGLMHAYRDHLGWNFQTVDPENRCLYFGINDISIDNANGVHIAYIACECDFGGCNCLLKYAHYENDSWDLIILDSSAGIPAMDVDRSGRPHIIYQGSAGLMYAYQAGPYDWQWSTETTGLSGFVSSFSLDREDRPHVSHIYNKELRYSYKDNIGWHTQIVDAAYDKSLLSSSLALDQNQNPHLVYGLALCQDFVGCTDFEIRYAYYVNSAWTIRVITREGASPSLVVDSAGHPHICYHNTESDVLKYAYLDDQGWRSYAVDTLGDSSCSLALDRLGYPRLAYVSRRQADGYSVDVLKYAYIPSPILLYNVYLPLLMRNHISFFEGPWEVEPNNSAQEANGPLRSGRDYYGYPNDTKDYFSIYLRTAGQITIDLNNHPDAEVQLQLFYQTPGNRVAGCIGSPCHVSHTGSAGLYYIYIYSAGPYNTITPYTLRVTYPQ